MQIVAPLRAVLSRILILQTLSILFLLVAILFHQFVFLFRAYFSTGSLSLLNIHNLKFLFILSVSYRVSKKIPLLNTNDDEHKEAKVRWRMKLIVCVVPLCFITRAIVMISTMFINLECLWWYEFLYYNFLEILPLTLLVLLPLDPKSSKRVH